MEFTKFDIVLITTMVMSLIIMAIVFPMVGLAANDDSTNITSVPSFNTTNDTFDLAGDYPDATRPNAGTLEYDTETGNSVKGVTIQWIEQPENEGLSVEVQNFSGTPRIVVINWSSTATNGVVSDDEYILSEGDGEANRQITHQNQSWTIVFDVQEVQNVDQPNMSIIVDYRVEHSPSDVSGFDQIPLIGGAADDLAHFVGYIASSIGWFVLSSLEAGLNAVTLLLDVWIYGIDLMHWLLSTFHALISGAPAWAGLMMTIPVVLLYLEFVKLVFIVISLLPTT